MRPVRVTFRMSAVVVNVHSTAVKLGLVKSRGPLTKGPIILLI